MKIYCEINDETIRRAASIVQRHYKDPEFLKMIQNVSAFNFTDDSPEIVAHNLAVRMSLLEINIVGYKTINPFSKVIGHAKGNTIFINTRKLNIHLIDRIANLYHEATHLCSYSHDGNRVTQFNLRTVPYLSASLFARYIQSICD